MVFGTEPDFTVVGEVDAAGRASTRKTWSLVRDELFVDTRTWQFVKLRRWFVGGGWPGARQLNNLCGLSPTNG